MTEKQPFKIIDGIECYNPEVVESYIDYPEDGFDLSDENDEGSFWVRSRNRLFKRAVFNNLKLEGKTELLEIGCGTGGFIQQIVNEGNLEITGSEIYLKGLFCAKRKNPDVKFVQFDVASGQCGKDFDMIIAFDVLEHIENDGTAIENINKMLCEGGKLLISVPQHMFLWGKLDEIVKHKRRYSRQELVEKLQKRGFKIKRYTSFVFVLFPLMFLSRLVDKGPNRVQFDKGALEKRVRFPKALDLFFDLGMRIDEFLIGLGLSLPFGGTLLVIAEKNDDGALSLPHHKGL